MTTADEQAIAARRKRRRGNLKVFSLIGVGVFVLLAVLIGRSSISVYDRSHVIRVTCEVTSAQGGIGGSSSTRGVGTRFDQVEIASSDCGDLVLRRGVTGENKADIAHELERDRRVSFRIGELSYHWRAVLPRIRIPVYVYSYRAAE